MNLIDYLETEYVCAIHETEEESQPLLVAYIVDHLTLCGNHFHPTDKFGTKEIHRGAVLSQ